MCARLCLYYTIHKYMYVYSVCIMYLYIYNNILYSVWRKRARLVSHAFPLATRVVCSGYTENTKKSYEEYVVFIEPFIFFPARSTAIVNVSSLWLKTYINNCYCNSFIYICVSTVNWTLVYYNVKEKLTL